MGTFALRCGRAAAATAGLTEADHADALRALALVELWLELGLLPTDITCLQQAVAYRAYLQLPLGGTPPPSYWASAACADALGMAVAVDRAPVNPATGKLRLTEVESALLLGTSQNLKHAAVMAGVPDAMIESWAAQMRASQSGAPLREN